MQHFNVVWDELLDVFLLFYLNFLLFLIAFNLICGEPPEGFNDG